MSDEKLSVTAEAELDHNFDWIWSPPVQLTNNGVDQIWSPPAKVNIHGQEKASQESAQAGEEADRDDRDGHQHPR